MIDREGRKAFRKRAQEALDVIAGEEARGEGERAFFRPFRVQLEALLTWTKDEADPDPELLERITIGNQNTIVIRMNFSKRKETVPVPSKIHEGGLQGRFDPRHLGQKDTPLELFSNDALVIEFNQATSIDDGDPRFFHVGRVYQHFPRHVTILPGARPCRISRRWKETETQRARQMR